MGASSRQQDSSFGWLTYGPAVLTGVGVLIYGILNISYSLFYDRLGVRPEDVGLTYVTTLSRSTGFIALAAGVLAFGVFPLLIRRRLIRGYDRWAEQDIRHLESSMRDKGMDELEIRDRLAVRREFMDSERQDVLKQGKIGLATTISVAVVAVLVLFLTLSIPWFALPRASEARSGNEVSPIRILGLNILAVSAHKATIQATGKPGETDTIDALRLRPLLYLGQAGGTLVFFDGESKEAVFVPASSAVVRVESE